MKAEPINETKVIQEQHEELDYHRKYTRNPTTDTL